MKPGITPTRWTAVAALAAILPMAGCRDKDHDDDDPGVSQVFLVMEENADFEEVVGNPSMPYLNNLIRRYGLATQYYANSTSSIANYFMLTTGEGITNDPHTRAVVSVDNVVRCLRTAGLTWKSYAEDLPYAGFVQLDYDDGSYLSRHNPVVYLSDVQDDDTQAANVVPFTQFAGDLAGDDLPNFSFIVPNRSHNAGDRRFAEADAWLMTHIDPLIRSPRFQREGLLIITFDEAGVDSANGGGRVACVIVSPRSRAGHQSSTFFQHHSTLRFLLKSLGRDRFPGAAARAPDMDEFLN